MHGVRRQIHRDPLPAARVPTGLPWLTTALQACGNAQFCISGVVPGYCYALTGSPNGPKQPGAMVSAKDFCLGQDQKEQPPAAGAQLLGKCLKSKWAPGTLCH